MKRLVVKLSLLLILSCLTANGDDVIVAPIGPGQCVADVWSKSYLSPIDQSPIKYSCNYSCVDSAGKKILIKAQHDYVKIGVLDDMAGLVCESVRIEMDKHELYTLAKVYADSFWAPVSQSAEIRQWAKTIGLKVPSEVAAQVHSKFRRDFTLVSAGYLGVDANQYPEFREAALMMDKISADSPEGAAFLKLEFAKVRNGTPPSSKGENLLLMNLKSSGLAAGYLSEINQ